MTKSAKTCPFIAVFGLYLMSNSLSSMTHFINLPEVSGLCSTCFIGYYVEISMVGGVFGLRLPMPGLISPFLGTFPLLLSELGCNSRLAATLCLCL